MFNVGDVLYTKAGNYTEVVKVDMEQEYPLICEITLHGETILDSWTLEGVHMKGKKSILDLEIE